MLVYGDDNGMVVDNNDIWIVCINLVGGVQWVNKYIFFELVNSKEIILVENGYVFLVWVCNSLNMYFVWVNG